MKTIVLNVFILFLVQNNIYSQNLLDTSTWTLGSGSVSGFSQNGSTSENFREYGENHLGDNVILWKGGNDSANNADGGWNSAYKNIDKTKTYRLSVWIKKTNSTDGRTYFGCKSYSGGANQTLNLNGTLNNNPYFWHGDLPILNRWYLLIGYIHKKSYSSTISLGKIYDGVTGEAVLNITDFKFSHNATNLRHRAYLYYDTNTNDRQYFWAPRMEAVDGSEWTFSQLLGVNLDSKLVFNFDNEGNQNQRFYCTSGNCMIPIPDALTDENIPIRTMSTNKLDENNSNYSSINIYPNPTTSILNIELSNNQKIEGEIEVYNLNGQKVHEIKANNKSTKTDISNLSSGTYILHFHLEDGSSVTKKIIKK